MKGSTPALRALPRSVSASDVCGDVIRVSATTRDDRQRVLVDVYPRGETDDGPLYTLVFESEDAERFFARALRMVQGRGPV